MASWEDVTENPFVVAFANKTDYISCDASGFEGVDPLPGMEKECYCDSKIPEGNADAYN